MEFEWDPNKNIKNKEKHNIDFTLAVTVFDDPFALIAIDEKHSELERREWIIGLSDSGILVVIFTKRFNGNITRIISARKANKKERSLYETYKRIPL